MEGYMGVGMPLPTAIENVDESIGLGEPPPVQEDGTVIEHVPTPAENDRALAELQKAMEGLR